MNRIAAITGRLRCSFYQHFRDIFWIAAVLLVAFVAVMRDRESPVHNNLAPYGIVSLELCFNDARADSIRAGWERDSLVTAIEICSYVNNNDPYIKAPVIERVVSNIWLDMGYILAYGLFILVMVWRLDVTKRNDGFFQTGSFCQLPLPGVAWYTWLMTLLTLAAMVLDVVENLFMLDFLRGAGMLHAVSFALPATVKFIFLGIVVLYLVIQLVYKNVAVRFIKRLSRYLENIAAILWQYRLVVAGLLIIFLALWIMDQGQDLLLNINTSRMGPVLFLLTVTGLAFLNWHLPKYLSNYRPVPGKPLPWSSLLVDRWDHGTQLIAGPDYQQKQQRVARLFGVLTFLLPACGILNALLKFGVPYWLDVVSPGTLLLITYGLYAIVLRKEWLERLYKWAGPRAGTIAFFVLCLAAGVVIGYLGLLPANYYPAYLTYLSLDLFILSFLFLVFTTLRSEFKTCFSRPLRYISHHVAIWLLPAGALLALLFFMANIFPLRFSLSRYFTLPMVVCGIIFYTYLFGAMIIAGRRWRINLAAFVLIGALAMNLLLNNHYHDVRTTDQAAISRDSLETLDAYTLHWLEQRRPEIEAFAGEGKKYPVFLVNAYGGGIRAAAWTCMQIAFLDSVMAGQGLPSFQHYVLSYSGASGGTIGASLLCAYRYRYRDSVQYYSPDHFRQFYHNDFLTPVLLGLQGRDIWNASLGIEGVRDRAAIQEQVWENHLQAAGVQYDLPYYAMWYSSERRHQYDIPLLFSNTYQLEAGVKGVVAPVRLRQKDFAGTILPDLLCATGKNLRLSTGAFLSARFPYISPAGRLDNNHHFLDGGLKENSGGETSREIYEVVSRLDTLQEVRQDSTLAGLLDKVAFYVLSVDNTVGSGDPVANTQNVFEITAPLNGLINNFEGTTLRADRLNQQYFGDRYFKVRPKGNCLYDTTAGYTFRPLLPLGWQISDQALDRMYESIHTPQFNKEARSMLEQVFGVVSGE